MIQLELLNLLQLQQDVYPAFAYGANLSCLCVLIT